ncbi:MAG TPA: EAL domain-containing protein [Oceanospirillales bacterium]|nr:EAL domain-containing protein [Oceanospirillales bacterium]
MAQDNTIHLLIIQKHEEEAERILSILRNAQIPVRPSRCTDVDSLNEHLANKRIDIILVQLLQTELPISTVNHSVQRIGKDIPIIALLDHLDNDSVTEAYEAGIKNFCTGSIHDQLCAEISNVFNCLLTRRKLRRFEVDLNDAEKRCASLLDSSKDAIAYIHDGMHVYTNNAYLEFFKYNDPEEMEVTPFLNLVAKDQVQDTKKLLRDISANKIPEDDITIKLKTENGEEMDAIVSLDKATIDGEPCVQFLVQPPKVNKEAEKELRDIKNKDMLTGFFNRSYFSKELINIINDVKSEKSAGHSILYIQIDDDRKLEKELGKGNLDLLISDMAPFIKEIIGEEHTYVRYDNTLFAIAMEGQIETASQMAQHLVGKISDHFFSAGEKTLSCTVSIGLTQIIEKTKTGNEVIKILGAELEKARENGGSRISVFDPAEEEKKARAANQKWIDLITDGLSNNKFILHYQPVISLHGDEIEHYETLVRLQDGDKLVMPSEFIGIAKRHGLILDIDRHVINHALKAIKEADKDVALFVKMSTDTLSNPSFPTWLAQELKANALSGEKIIFETPESELVSHSKHVKPVIQAIKGLNCQFAIEKFGSGLNSFTLLKHYPIDFIKIDSTFMQDFANNDDNQKKVKEIIDQAHAQNKMVICEFIEDAATMSILWKYSANYVQGNFLAPASKLMTNES